MSTNTEENSKKDFYVYIYQNIKIPTINYKISTSYGDFDLSYEPFYVGKGKGNRAWDFDTHNSAAQYVLNSLSMELKFAKVVKIIKNNMLENDAYKLEHELIKKLGRRIDGTGPLVNYQSGHNSNNVEINTYKIIETENNYILQEKFGQRPLTNFIVSNYTIRGSLKKPKMILHCVNNIGLENDVEISSVKDFQHLANNILFTTYFLSKTDIALFKEFIETHIPHETELVQEPRPVSILQKIIDLMAPEYEEKEYGIIEGIDFEILDGIDGHPEFLMLRTAKCYDKFKLWSLKFQCFDDEMLNLNRFGRELKNKKYFVNANNFKFSRVENTVRGTKLNIKYMQNSGIDLSPIVEDRNRINVN